MPGLPQPGRVLVARRGGRRVTQLLGEHCHQHQPLARPLGTLVVASGQHLLGQQRHLSDEGKPEPCPSGDVRRAVLLVQTVTGKRLGRTVLFSRGNKRTE